MPGKVCGNEYRTTMICIDSYDQSILCGRLINPYLSGSVPFEGLMQLLLRMEDLLDRMNFPQPFARTRSFAPMASQELSVQPENGQQGKLATFAVKVLFRQNASWQGSVTWLESGREESFRSVLELALLMHSALTGGQNP